MNDWETSGTKPTTLTTPPAPGPNDKGKWSKIGEENAIFLLREPAWVRLGTALPPQYVAAGGHVADESTFPGASAPVLTKTGRIVERWLADAIAAPAPPPVPETPPAPPASSPPPAVPNSTPTQIPVAQPAALPATASIADADAVWASVQSMLALTLVALQPADRTPVKAVLLATEARAAWRAAYPTAP